MKRYFIIVISIFLIAVNGNAQWRVYSYPADELKGLPAYKSYVYYHGEDYFQYDTLVTSVRIYIDEDIFNYDDDNQISVLIGYYEGDTLVEKEFADFFVSTGNANTAVYVSYGEYNPVAKKIITHLTSKGAVRLIAHSYGGRDYDIKVPMRVSKK